MCYLEEFINITFVVESVIAQAFIYTITDFMSADNYKHTH